MTPWLRRGALLLGGLLIVVPLVVGEEHVLMEQGAIAATRFDGHVNEGIDCPRVWFMNETRTCTAFLSSRIRPDLAPTAQIVAPNFSIYHTEYDGNGLMRIWLTAKAEGYDTIDFRIVPKRGVKPFVAEAFVRVVQRPSIPWAQYSTVLGILTALGAMWRGNTAGQVVEEDNATARLLREIRRKHRRKT